MSKKTRISIVLLSAILITLMFYKQPFGINLLIYELAFYAFMLFSKQLKLKSINSIIVSIGFVISAFATVFTYSVFAYIINFLVLLVFVGILIYPNSRSLLTALDLSVNNLFGSLKRFYFLIFSSKEKGKKIGRKLRKFSIFIIPIVVIIIFIAIYKAANPVFAQGVESIGAFIQKKWNFIFKDVNFMIVWTFILGLYISIVLFIRRQNRKTIRKDIKSSDNLIRKSINNTKKKYNITAIFNEYKSGVFLLIILNAIILILNIIDIKWVWFNFSWDGDYLKQFVHEGTYLLIISVLISIFLVLFYFRNNLNFFRKNKLLKTLSYVWLAQNAILVISVVIRNLWYIKYYSLAYKRIGVFIFLILTLYGLYTVFVKVRNRKTVSYLFKKNTLAIFIVLVVSSAINWDVYIAKYNFNNKNNSFVHFSYLAKLSDKALPYLIKSKEELKEIEANQEQVYGREFYYISYQDYYERIYLKKQDFIKEWEEKPFLSWNYQEYKAYKKLKELKE